jgi:hypothetical protein
MPIILCGKWNKKIWRLAVLQNCPMADICKWRNLRNNSLDAHKHTEFKSLIYEYMLAEDIRNNKQTILHRIDRCSGNGLRKSVRYLVRPLPGVINFSKFAAVFFNPFKVMLDSIFIYSYVVHASFQIIAYIP